jgi:4'-phosphopantetheinyl transferase EntD
MIVATLLSDVLPGTVAAAEMYTDPPDLAPLPEEEPLIARSVAKRRNEFVTVRYCARLALEELGVPPAPILKGKKGEPCWPDGVVGSLTHCDGYRGAAVGRHDTVRSVGIDAEPHDVLPNGVLDAISLPAERAEINALPAGLHWDRILFCAKEATYKVWFPVTRRWLGFEDAHIVFVVDDTGTAGGFESRILVDGAALSGPPLTALRGRWSVRDGLARRRRAVNRAGLVVVDKPAGVTNTTWFRSAAHFATRKVGRWHAGPDDHRWSVSGTKSSATTATDKSLRRDHSALRPPLPRMPTAKCCKRFRRKGSPIPTSKPRWPSCAARSRRHRRRSAPSRSAASGHTGWPARGRPSNWPPALCASTGSRCWTSGGRSLVDVDVEVDCSSGTYIRALCGAPPWRGHCTRCGARVGLELDEAAR